MMSGGTEDQIKKTAFEMFLNRGYKATTIRAIAEACGITHVNVVYHFKSKWELAKQIIDTYISQVALLSQTFNEKYQKKLSPLESYAVFWILHHQFMSNHSAFAAFYVEFGNLNRTETEKPRIDFGAGMTVLLQSTLGTYKMDDGLEFLLGMHLLVEADIQLVSAVASKAISLEGTVAFYLRTSLQLLRDESLSKNEAFQIVSNVLKYDFSEPINKLEGLLP